MNVLRVYSPLVVFLMATLVAGCGVSSIPTSTPSWAADMGKDQHGHWANFSLDGVKVQMRWIPPGTFTIGTPADEKHRRADEYQHEVTFARGYWLAATECTQALWQTVEGKNPSKFTGDSSLPVEKVSWDDCQAFLQRLNGRVSGLHARLPTEAEWEYACRAGTTGTHAGDMEAMGWFEDNANLQSHPVAQKKANAWGLYDMHGNVAEWCSDWYGDYSIDAITDPTGPATGKLRIHRGGAWVFVDFFCRSGQRDKTSQDSSYDSLGLRFVVPG